MGGKTEIRGGGTYVVTRKTEPKVDMAAAWFVDGREVEAGRGGEEVVRWVGRMDGSWLAELDV